MSVTILDAGISIIQAKISRRERTGVAFSHVLKQLTEAEHRYIISWAGVAELPPGYL